MKKGILVFISLLGLNACGDGSDTSIEKPKQNVFYGFDLLGGNEVNVRTYTIDHENFSIHSPLSFDKTYLLESDQYYFSDQGAPTLNISAGHDFIWGHGASFSETATNAILNFKPNNMKTNENLVVEYQFEKKDLTGLSFDAFAQNNFFYQIYKSSGDISSIGNATNDIFYAISFAHFDDKFPTGAACWKLTEIKSNKDYIVFDQKNMSNQTIDSNTPLENQGVWSGTAWQVIATSNRWNTFFKIGGQQYLGRYIPKKDVLPDVLAELQCDYLNETAVKALLTKYHQQ
ncbi:MAG: hypothetical protein E7I55_00280 [Acinetobacter ursingii]|nr:hypothetical protein [Acinetobacter ursingii]